jgi:DNA-binding beta-propeller fold protein YncE
VADRSGMRDDHHMVSTRLTTTLVLTAPLLAFAARAGDSPLVQVASIPLPGVQGRIDHLAVDLRSQRLYVAALGNNTVEVLGLRTNRHESSVAGFKEPQGIAVVPEPSAVVVANGQGEGAEFRSGGDLRLIRGVPLGDDADNVRVDAKATRVYVGYGSGAIAALDASDGRKLGEVPVGGHPESFQLEAAGPRIFVNVPTARLISVIDRGQMKTVASWSVTAAAANYPMALDEAGHRVFIGCRNPPLVLVYDTESGKQVGSVEIAGDTDDLFWDAQRQRLYVTAGEGFIDVLQSAGGTLRRTAHLASAAGARTSLFVAALGRLYVAVPHRGSQPAEIRVFEARD